MKVVLDSVESKVSLLKKAKKLEGKGGGRMVKGIHTSGPDTEAAGSQETSSGRTEAAEANGEKDLIIFNGKVLKRRYK